MNCMDDSPIDFEALLSVPLRWEVDPAHFLGLRARYRGTWLRMRINAGFPDQPMYSLEAGVDETIDFDDFPSGWERIGPLEWPEDAEGRP